MEQTNRGNIWNFKQNKPSLIVKDIIEKYPDVDPIFLYDVLLKRGVFKWFASRRNLIKLKNKWKEELKEMCELQRDNRKPYRNKLIFMLNRCRQDVRKICHSERWQSQDNDRGARMFLKSKG